MGTNDSGVRVVAWLARHFEHGLAEVQMTLPQYRLLAFLSEGPGGASAVADRLAVSRPSVTALVDNLVERGWVSREADADDRRRVLHRLTPDGDEALGTAAAALGEVLDGVLGHLDDDESARVIDGLDLLGEALRRRREVVRQ